MKKPLLSLYLFFICSLAYSQDWIPLKYPQSGILGKAVIYKDGDITPSPTNNGISNPKIDSTVSADNLIEYNEKFRNLITKYFTSSKYSVTETKAKKLVIKSVNIESLEDMDAGPDYVYSGLTADSVEVTIRTKKEQATDVSKIVKDVVSIFTKADASTVIGKVLPILDSVSYESQDSLSFKMTLANPEVFYKVKIISLKEKLKHDWEGVFLYFKRSPVLESRDEDGQQILSYKLIWDPLESKNSTVEEYPRFYGKDDETRKYKLIAKKLNGEMKLYVMRRSGKKVKGKEDWTYTEVPQITEEGKNYWKMNRQLINAFEFRGRTKFVYVTIKAEQLNSNTILIYSRIGDQNTTMMQYPEAKFNFKNP